MKKIIFSKWPVLIVRNLLGINLLLSGVLILFGFVKLPPSNPPAENFINSLIDSGYEWQLIKITEIVAGILLLTNRFVPFALILIFPVTLNIALFNTILWPQGAPAGIFVFFSNIYLILAFFKTYKHFFTMKTNIQPL